MVFSWASRTSETTEGKTEEEAEERWAFLVFTRFTHKEEGGNPLIWTIDLL